MIVVGKSVVFQLLLFSDGQQYEAFWVVKVINQ